MILPQYIQTETRSSSLKKNFSTYFSTTKPRINKNTWNQTQCSTQRTPYNFKNWQTLNSETCFQFLGTLSLRRKSSSMRGSPSLSFTFGSQPNTSLALLMSGFLCLGSSGVFSTIFISMLGLISCMRLNIKSLRPNNTKLKLIIFRQNWF